MSETPGNRHPPPPKKPDGLGPGRPARPVGGKSVPGKDELALLPPFSGLSLESIVTPAGTDQFTAALAEIRDAGAVGFDTESKPVFVKGMVRPGPDLAQFATANRGFVFQLHRAEGLPFLVEILRAEGILKVGFDLQSDRAALQKRLGIELKGVIDLTTVFRKRGYRNTTGVRAAVGIVLQRNFHKSKRVTTSNWALPELSPKQLEYAANDAFAALQVWIALGRPIPGKRS